jgi:eukaryotic-like serine/threonine-protein kinase
MALPRIAHYQLLESVGEGGMGTVYRGEDVRNGAAVAVKVLDESRAQDPQIFSRFRREARIEAALRHPNIAAFHDFGEHVSWSEGGGRRRFVYLVIEWIPGVDLAEILAWPGKVPAERAVEYARQIAGALEAAHAVGVVHRDLKPSNIRITLENRVKILDFGLAKILEETELHRDHPPTFQTTIGSLLGTAPYMAPEQLFGKGVDFRTDLFALGVILYQMITGQVPFSGRNILEILQAVSTQEPVRPSVLVPEVPPALEDIVLRLLAKEPSGRPASATELLASLEGL